MLLHREWGDAVEVPDAWRQPRQLSRYPLWAMWSDPVVCPCDANGFRMPPGFRSFRERFESSTDVRRIVCIGGSTTFGAFGDYEHSYPAQLERVLGVPVFNLGKGAADMTTSLHVLVDLFRWGYVPDTVVFHNGVNEKQAWEQAKEGRLTYEEMSPFYAFLSDQGEQADWRRRIGARRRQARFKQDPLTFVSDQAAIYLGARRIAEQICRAWRVEPLFFLEPSVWDVWDGTPDPGRYPYLKALYKLISAGDESVVDLSTGTALMPGMFLDWHHLDPAGNAVLANEIARRMPA